jgi:hypothetical protein
MRTILLLAATASGEFLRGATHIQLAGCNADCGRLEVKLHEETEWRAVTSNNWTRADAIKTCARLGFEDVASISSPFAAAAARGDRAVLDGGSVRTCVGGECSMPAVGVACRGKIRRRSADIEAAMARIDAWASHRRARLRAALRHAHDGNATSSDLTVSIDDIEAARALPFDGADRVAAVKAQRRTIEFLERYPGAAHALHRLKARGLLEITPLGIVMREGMSSQEAELAYEAYLASDPNGDVHFEFDGRRRLAPSPSSNDAVLALRRDGVARIRDWGVLTDSIEKKATRSLQGSRKTLSTTSDGRVATARYFDRRLERFFRSINDIASGYLGEAQLSGYKVVRICVETFVSLHAIEPTRSRGKRRVDGVGRPKFDFHTGAHRHDLGERYGELRGGPVAPRPRREPAQGLRVSARRRLRRGPPHGGGRRFSLIALLPDGRHGRLTVFK